LQLIHLVLLGSDLVADVSDLRLQVTVVQNRF